MKTDVILNRFRHNSVRDHFLYLIAFKKKGGYHED